MAGETEFFQAIRSGDRATVEGLVAAQPTLVDARSPLGSAVLVAMYYGEPEIARMLVERGAGLDLFEAAAVGVSARVQELGSAGGVQPDADYFERVFLDTGVDLRSA